MNAPTTRMNIIELRARVFAERHAKLRDIVTALESAREALMKAELPKIRRALAAAAEAESDLKAILDDSADLFVKPRSAIFHGIKVGFAKGKGKIEWDDPDQVVRLIHKHFPEQADVLIVTAEKPAKDALANLTASELKRLGVTIEDSGDVAFIRPVDGAVDKLVKALLKAATAEVTEVAE